MNLNPSYIGHCLLDSPADEKVPLYESSYSDIIVAYIVNDGYNEDYPDLYIKERKGNRVLVDAEYGIPGRRYHEDESGWLDINYLYTEFNEGFLMKRIYSQPSHNSDIILKIKREKITQWKFKVLDVSNYWLKIKIGDTIGWLPPEFSVTTAEEEDGGNLPLVFINTSISTIIPIYKCMDDKNTINYINYDEKEKDKPFFYILNYHEGDNRVQGHLYYGKYFYDYSGWIDSKYLITYLKPELEYVNLYDDYEDGNIILTIKNIDKTLAYPTIAIWYLGWVKIIDPVSKKAGWLPSQCRVEKPSDIPSFR